MPNVALAAARDEVMAEVRRVMGPAVYVEPMEALLWCVRIAAGEVAYSTWKVEGLEEHEAIGSPESTVTKEGVSGGKEEAWEEVTHSFIEVNLWIRVRREALDRLAKYSKMALDAGVAERAVALAETAGDSLALAIREILDGLQLSVTQEERAPELVRGALVRLERETYDVVDGDAEEVN